MNTLNTPQQLRERFDIKESVSDERLGFCLKAAARTIKEWVGRDEWQALEGRYAFLDTQHAIETAELRLAMYHYFLNTGARTNPFNGTEEYMPANEVRDTRQRLYDEAVKLIAPYRKNEGMK